MQTTATAVIPSAKSIPYLGIALDMRIDCLRYFVKLSHEYGSVFRVTLLGRPIIIRAGLDANRFLAKEGDEYRDVGSAARHSGSEHKHGASSPEQNWSLIRPWGCKSALRKWHMRRSVGGCGSGACSVR
ncbi:MAG: hypothetical protein O3B43_06880 [Chloroflexi bacterium]|nr:hypothetical protein [Chloroflexota bacterium]